MHKSTDPAKPEQLDPVREEFEIVRQSQQGDGAAFQKLVEKHQNSVSSIMWRFSRDYDTHQELVQDVFVEAFMSLKNYRPQAPFFHWLSRIAVRVGFRYWKKQKREQNRPHVSLDEWEPLSDSNAPDILSSKEAADLLHRLLSQLTPRNRLALTLRFIEERSVEETAHLTGWSQTMVKVQTFRARTQFKKLFEKIQGKETP